MTAAQGRRALNATLTTHVPHDVDREIRRLARERGISVSACAAALLVEALRMPLEHQHAALVEAAISKALGQHLERLEDLTHRASRESYRGRWLVARMLALLGDRMPPAPSQDAEGRASRLNAESHRKARTWLGEDGWAEPS